MAYGFHLGALWIFATSMLAIVPLADFMRKATERLAHRSGPTIGGLLVVTFGNATELILAIFVLLAGQQTTAKAQITGSIVGNSLLGLGLACLVGGVGRTRQKFNRERAGNLTTMLILVVIAIMIPAAFDFTERSLRATNTSQLDEKLSLFVAVVLIALYAANLVYTLVTHRDVYSGGGEEAKEGEKAAAWPVWVSLLVLLGATVLVGVESEMISGALDGAATSLGVTRFFLGITLLAVIGNAAEYLSAIYFARQNRMSLAMTVTLGATIQVGLLIAPVLVIVGFFIGQPMSLVFSSPLELIAIAASAFAVNSIARDGESSWFEGALLVGVYLLLALAFFFVTPVA